ncbi:hypothetical protein K435DRAFT_871225 [Dendrothele bispora CBS 962.96]|uniref:Uncharacterized protein n=1 Tax=Dendrothele bispora (strain CBS 962.96) TaxID=1314807 RepID=A0A4V4HCI3_DENBC|nr:hypothetical protein K435DRAFT_871225 [Dendrothele bispora CBS 962.96]
MSTQLRIPSPNFPSLPANGWYPERRGYMLKNKAKRARHQCPLTPCFPSSSQFPSKSPFLSNDSDVDLIIDGEEKSTTSNSNTGQYHLLFTLCHLSSSSGVPNSSPTWSEGMILATRHLKSSYLYLPLPLSTAAAEEKPVPFLTGPGFLTWKSPCALLTFSLS